MRRNVYMKLLIVLAYYFSGSGGGIILGEKFCIWC